MEKEKFEFGYLHPEVKVVLFKARQVLCGSPIEEQGFGLDNDGQMDDGGDL